MDKIVIWGATGQAIVMEELLMYFDTSIIAFFENNENVISPIKHVPIYYKKEGYKKWLNTLEEKDIKNYKFIIAIGGHYGQVRANIGEYLKKDGLTPYNAIHKTAFIAKNSILGEGCQVLANTSVCARVVLGNYCIVNTSASIDHECKIGNNTHIGPGAKLAGCTTIGENVFIGTGAVLLPRLIIGNNSIIGAGAVVTKDIPPFSVAVGNPAKVIKTIEPINFKDNKLLK